MIVLSLLLTFLPAEARITRIHSAKAERQRPNPRRAAGARSGGCKGYVIDHIKALACGGADDPINMLWKTIAEGKAMGKWVRKEYMREVIPLAVVLTYKMRHIQTFALFV